MAYGQKMDGHAEDAVPFSTLPVPASQRVPSTSFPSHGPPFWPNSTPIILPPVPNESKRDRKRRETINKIEMLHDESWRTRDEKFSALYREYHNENRAVCKQPPQSAQYDLRLYPKSLERDALFEATEVSYQYKMAQARKAFDAERELIEAQYHEARDQVRQRLLGSIEERRRKLREEKEGGDVISENLLEQAIKARPKRRMPFKGRIPRPPVDPFEVQPLTASTNTASNGDSAPSTAPIDGAPLANGGNSSTSSTPDSSQPPRTDLLLHSLLAPSLAQIDISTILVPSSTSLVLLPPTIAPVAANGKQARRGGAAAAKGAAAAAAAAAAGGAGGDDVAPAPGTATALAIASGQQAPRRANGNNAGASTTWVLGKSLAELKKMESATQLECDADWARIQGGMQRARRARAD